MEYKWTFCEDHICYKCKRVIPELKVKEVEVVTGCPFCKTSFVS